MSLIYALPSDNVAATVTPTLHTGTINANFPITRLIDRDPATAAKTTSTGDSRWLWDYTSAQRVDAVWIPIHNAVAGTVLRFEGNATNAWGAPTCSATHTVQAYGGDLPRGVYIDVTAASGYSTGGFRYWSLFVPNTSIITALGEIFISSRKRTAVNPNYGFQRPRSRIATINDRNDGGAFVYDRGTNLVRFKGHVRMTTTDFAAYLALYEDCRGPLYPFPVVVDGHLTNPEGFLMRWVSEFDSEWQHYSLEGLDIEWAMVPRGRAL